MKLNGLLPAKGGYKTQKVSKLYLKLRSKFTLAFFLLIMLPFLVFAAAAYIHSKAALEKNTREMAIMEISQEKNSVNNMLKTLREEIGAVTTDSSLGSAAESSLDVIRSGASVGRLLDRYLTPGLKDALSGAYILRGNSIRAAFDKSDERAIISSPSAQAWYAEAVANPGRVVIIGAVQRFYGGGSNKTVFSSAAALANTGGGMPVILLVDCDYSLLYDILAPSGSNATGEQKIIIDQRNNVIYSSDPKAATITADSVLLGLLGREALGFGPVNYQDKAWYLAYEMFQDTGWTYVTLIPAAAVTSALSPSGSPAALACLILVPLVMLVYLAVSTVLLKPMNELTAVISGQVAEGQGNEGAGRLSGLRQELSGEKPANESEINFLIDKVYSIRLKQKEAELNSLQNQINPHFLYNTLESIRGAALHNGISEIADMSKALSLLFRYSISNRVLVTIREEIQHLENYMSIQNFRYENKFDLTYSVSPELYDYKILKLTLQPLIENSIKHGLEMKLGKGAIKIDIMSYEKNIKIVISDDGLGIPSKKVEELNRALSREEYRADGENQTLSGTGIGVRNVNSRIKLYFGAQYGLKFRDVLAGTMVELTLPAVKED